MSDTNINNEYTYGKVDRVEEPLKIDFSKIVVSEETSYTPSFNAGIIDSITSSKVEFGSISAAYKKDEEYNNTFAATPTIINDANSNITYLNTTPSFATTPATEKTDVKGSGNVFANTTAKTTSAELQRIVQKLDKLEKMINPNSKKSLILWEEDNSFKNLISSVVTYANSCDTTDEFPIEIYDRLKALSEDVENQIKDGAVKVTTLNEQQKHNTVLSEILSNAYVSATAGLPREEYEANVTDPEISSFKEQLATIATTAPDSEEYKEAEKAIKSKITNLENSVHITIDLERTTSKASALEYIKKEITPAVSRLQEAYDKQYSASNATLIDGEEAITALVVKKSFTQRIYDTFVRPIANLFKRKSKAK
ncbi:MAG: hypothetical protein IKI57_01335 [Clostridia bacterium]|nr:hypothetical protein [Clostridia bacterium]